MLRLTEPALHPQKTCHPERVIKLLHHIVFIAHNMPIFCCVGTVQGNCANFREFRLLQVLRSRGAGVRRTFFRSRNSNAQNNHVHTQCRFLLFILLTINDRSNARSVLAEGR